MNTIELRIGDDGRVRVIIDGADLVDRVREIEAPAFAAEGIANLAGTYGGMQPYEWVDLPEQYGDGRAAVLGCDCGEVGCWPLRVRITREGGTVTWSDFWAPGSKHTPSLLESLGPFVFDGAAYDAAVSAVLAHAGVMDP